MQPTLVILAAGMGSRFGGLKQMVPIGPSGETLMDYSIFDAKRAGFGRVVFIIRREMDTVFRDEIGGRYAGHIAVDYAYQELDDLPGDHTVPAGRTKPWGTGQAVLAAREIIREPFAVANADDFYGQHAFQALGEFLAASGDDAAADVRAGRVPAARHVDRSGYGEPRRVPDQCRWLARADRRGGRDRDPWRWWPRQAGRRRLRRDRRRHAGVDESLGLRAGRAPAVAGQLRGVSGRARAARRSLSTICRPPSRKPSSPARRACGRWLRRVAGAA